MFMYNYYNRHNKNSLTDLAIVKRNKLARFLRARYNVEVDCKLSLSEVYPPQIKVIQPGQQIDCRVP